MKKPRVINLYAGPGTGKSTTMHALMAELKYLGNNVEVSPEYAKEATWEMRGTKFFGAQEYIWAKQHFRLYRIASDVDISITDCPLLFCTVYGDECHKRMPSLKNVIAESYNNYDNLDIFLNRSKAKAYNPKGRNQNEKEAKVLDRKIRKALDTYVGKGNYIELEFGRENVEQILDILITKGWIKQEKPQRKLMTKRERFEALPDDCDILKTVGECWSGAGCKRCAG
jgi:hypothetical protein